MRTTTALLLLLIATLFTTQAGAATKVQAVRYATTADASRVVLEVSNSPNYKVFSLPNPPRVVIDLFDARLTSTLPSRLVGGTVQKLRSGIRHGRDLRVVLDLSAKAVPNCFVLQPSDHQGYRLVVDLKGGVPAPIVAKAQVVTPTPPAAAAPVAAAPVVKHEIAAVAPPAPTKLRDIVVAIDAGHGGVDPGAHGPHGIKEKNVTLAIARQLKKELEAVPGFKPMLTRSGDYFVPLRKRVAKARDFKADLMVSIHADAIDDRSVRGSSVYILSDRGATSEAARWLAEKENAADLVGGVSLDDKDDVLKSVLIDLSQTASIEASAKAGKDVLQELRHVGKLHRHHVEQAGFVVLKAPDIPSMLVETAFISNPREEHNLSSPAYQKRLAEAIKDGIQEYFHDNAPPGTKVAMAGVARKHVIARGDTLSEIADQYGVSVHTLRVSNNLSGDNLYVGKVLRIPPSDGT